MDFNIVTNKRRYPDGSIELSLSDPFSDQPKEKIRFAAIRGGICWPTPEASAYFCIVGQLYKDPERYKDAGEKVLMSEYQSDSFTLTKFYHKLIDTAVQLHCDDFYAIVPENRSECGFTHDFQEYCFKRASNIHLTVAYDQNNFMLGMSRIRESLENESLSLPDDSIIKMQLLGISRDDVRQGKPEERFHAVNGLRHVLGSFYRHNPVNRTHFANRRAANWRTA